MKDAEIKRYTKHLENMSRELADLELKEKLGLSDRESKIRIITLRENINRINNFISHKVTKREYVSYFVGFILIVLLFMLIFIPVAKSESNTPYFYMYISENKNSEWNVLGMIPEGSEGFCVCSNADYPDMNGPVFNVVQRMNESSVEIVYTNVNEWNIDDRWILKEFSSEMAFYNSDGTKTHSYKANVTLTSSYGMRIYNVDPDIFIPRFAESSKIIIVMPDNIPNVVVSLKGTANALGHMAQCIEKYKEVSGKGISG